MKHLATLLLLTISATAHGMPLLADSAQVYTRTVSTKHYELNDHLGNIRAVVSDVKEPVNAADHKQGFTAQLLSSSHYDAFGMELADRGYASAKYRYGFNGKEKDDEWKGSGNSYDFDARIYDPRVGRWLSTDPLSDKFPDQSPYDFAFNNPVTFIDPDGKAPKVKIDEKIKASKDFAKTFEILQGSEIYSKQTMIIFESTGQELEFYGREAFTKEEIMKSPTMTEEKYGNMEILGMTNPGAGSAKPGKDGQKRVFINFGNDKNLPKIEYFEEYKQETDWSAFRMGKENRNKKIYTGVVIVTEDNLDQTYLAALIYHETMHHVLDITKKGSAYKNDHDYMGADEGYRNECIAFMREFDKLSGQPYHSDEWYYSVATDFIGSAKVPDEIRRKAENYLGDPSRIRTRYQYYNDNARRCNGTKCIEPPK